MSTVIQIKRSSSGNAPDTTILQEGELAYSYDQTNNGANAILYIEVLNSGSAEVIHKIGGKYYTDIVDAATPSNTASTLVKRDGAGGFAGNLYGRANVAAALDSTYVNNVIPGSGVTVSGTHTVPSANLTISLSNTTVSPGSYGGASAIPTIIVDEKGRITFAANNSVAASSFTIRGNSGTDTFNTGDVMDILGVAPGISTAVTDNTIAITNTGVTNVAATVNHLVVNQGTGNVTLSLANTGITAATYGGPTNVPVITFDAQGRAVSATNASFSTSFTIAGDTGTDTFNSGDVFRILGTAPGISTAATDNTITVTNTGVTGFSAGVGLSTTAASGNITVVNTGVREITTSGAGLVASGSTGNISLTNTGVTGLTSAGNGLVLSGSSGNITATFTGVGSVVGTSNEIEVTGGPAGNVTIGLPNDVTIGNNLTVTGNLYVLGEAVTVNTSVVTIEDPLVKFGNANPSDALDIGFYGQYNSGGEKYAGLFRDASDSGLFKLFTDLTSDPTNNTVNEANFTLGTLKSNLTAGNVTNLVNALAVNSGGTGRKTLTANTVLIGDTTNSVRLAGGVVGQVLLVGTDGMVKFANIDGGSY